MIYAFAFSGSMTGLHFGTLSSLKTVPENFFRTLIQLFQGMFMFRIHLSGGSLWRNLIIYKIAKLQERKGIASAPRPCAQFSNRSRAGKLFPACFL